jgi:hypothetical protein
MMAYAAGSWPSPCVSKTEPSPWPENRDCRIGFLAAEYTQVRQCQKRNRDWGTASVDGRAFLDAARHLLSVPTEANWRSAAGCLYLALLNEARVALERWGFPLPVGGVIDTFVLDHVASVPHLDLLRIEDVLLRGDRLRHAGGYELSTPGDFANNSEVQRLLLLVTLTIDLLDQVEADPARRSGLIAALRTIWP